MTQSLVADGGRIGRGVVIDNSIIGLRCVIGDNVTIRNSILMGADEYDGPQAPRLAGQPDLGIGAGSVVEGAIVDKNCRIGGNVVISNERGIDEMDRGEECLVRDGVPVVVKEAVLPNGWKLHD